MFLAAGLSGAQDLKAQGIRTTISRTEATVEDQLRLTVTIEGSQRAQPQLPDLTAFQVFSRGPSTQVRIVNGRTTASVSHNYILIPKTTGTFTIGPATVELNGQTYKSQPIRVRIVEASAQPRESRDVFVTARVSELKPYVGQQILYTWRLYRRVQIGQAELGQQDFDGFLVEDLGEAKTFKTTVNGQQYAVHEIRKALFPQEAGTVVVPAAQLQVQILRRSRRRGRSLFDDFFGSTETETKVLRTQPIELQVRSLPATPPGFSGLVGKFSLKSKISQRELKVGESATLSLTVSGSGNAQMIAEPQLPDFSQFKTYEDLPKSSLQRKNTGLSGRKVFSRAIVPLVPGELEIPSLELIYFDPERGSYRTARTERIPLQVAPADGKEDLRLTESVAPNTGKVAVRILADDILPLYRNLDAVRPRAFGEQPGAGLAIGLSAPPLLFFALLWTQRRKRLFAQDTGLRRRREALRNAQRCLRELPEASDPVSAAAASRCLRSYIGDKLGLEGSALTPKETAHHLEAEGVPSETVQDIRRFLEELEASQYGGAGVGAGAASERISTFLKSLEGALR